MINLLKKEANNTYTENGALTNRSSMSECLDLFACIGALRNRADDEIVNRFKKAYMEDGDLAMKILFFARDIRGGLGERRAFRTIMNWLAFYRSESVLKNLQYFAEFGRYDDLLSLLDTPCEAAVVELISNQFEADLENSYNGKPVTLLAKWLPSANASNRDTIRKGKKIEKALHMNDEQYRKTLARLRAAIKIIENNLRECDYSFDYEKQASKAMFKYRKAFIRNDGERYEEYLNRIERGEAIMKTGALTPYDIIRPIYSNNWSRPARNISGEERKSINTTWEAQEDFTSDKNAIAVIDISGSMYWGQNALPAAVAHSLGIYYAERNKGRFANHFITFSETPQLIEIKGKDIVDKVNYISSFNEYANTDLMSVFRLILETAVKHKVLQSELPSTIYIVSDMEFDDCVLNADKTNLQCAQELFEMAGYSLPRIIFWNVESRNTQQPATINDEGIALVSGFSPRILSMVISGEISPYKAMMDVIGVPRYSMIAA